MTPPTSPSSTNSPGLRGVYAAVLTPFTEALEPDLKNFLAHCRWLLANGCDGLAPLGTTGEANSMSMAQRLTLIEAIAEAKLPIGKFIIGTGACAIADAASLTRTVVEAGAGGALLLPPFYYKNPSEDGLYAFFSEVIQRVGDARLRVYLYHFPQMSAVPIPLTLIARLKAAYGDTIAGLKDSSGDYSYTEKVLKEFPGFGVFSGTEQYLLPTLRAGGAGCISATVNVTAPLAQPVYAAWRSGEADALQEALTQARVIFQSYTLQVALKEAAVLMTGNPQWRTLLPPNRPLSPADRHILIEKLRALPQLRDLWRAAA